MEVVMSCSTNRLHEDVVVKEAMKTVGNHTSCCKRRVLIKSEHYEAMACVLENNFVIVIL